MFSDTESQPRRIPTLVSYCQRILSVHADSLSCLGDDIRYELIKPVLECCSADTLLRLEQSSPYLEENTADLWESLCFKIYPLLAEQLMRNGEPHPDSWRKQFFLLRDAEAHRLEEVASKLRNQRMEAAERKKEREVKLTDRLPPAKRARSAASQPKTLFQKAKNEVKLRKSLYTSRVVPPMVQGKTYRVLPGPHSAKPPMASQSISQVTVSTIAVRHSSVSSTSSSVPSSKPRSSDIPAIPSSPTKLPQLSSSSNSTSLPSLSMYSSPAPTEPRLVKSPMQKKDPMASLFMPKHRALSQLPCQGKSVRSTPA